MIQIYPEPPGRPFIHNLFRRSRPAPGSAGLELGNDFQFPSPKPKENSGGAVRRRKASAEFVWERRAPTRIEFYNSNEAPPQTDKMYFVISAA